MQAGSVCLHPCTPSNFYLAIESLIFITGNSRFPLPARSLSCIIPIGVSSEHPYKRCAIVLHLFEFSVMPYRITESRACCSKVSASSGSGSVLSRSYTISQRHPSCISKAASPPSSIRRSGPFKLGQVNALTLFSQYSYGDSSLIAKTNALPEAAIAAAAWS